MYEDEPVNEYRIKVTVRNNLILNAIENAGYKSVSEFCRAVNLPVVLSKLPMSITLLLSSSSSSIESLASLFSVAREV